MQIPYYPNAIDLTGYMGGNCQNPRSKPITKVTPHHCAGIVDGKQFVIGIINMWKTRQASTNYIIDKSGKCYLIVPHNARSWASGNRDNDMQAITYEMSNDSNKYPWTISTATLSTAIDLTSWICAKYGITPFYTGNAQGTVTTHRMFQATQCPGDYFVKQWLENGEFCQRVKANIHKWQDGNVLEPEIEPITWYIQIGAYKRKENAVKQAQTLDGYAVISDNKGLYRVRKGVTESNMERELAIARAKYPKAFARRY